MEHLLTPDEMAGRLKISVKTLKKYVAEFHIPHTLVGRFMRFNPATVEACLAARPVEPSNVVRFNPVGKKSLTTEKSKFAQAVGL